MTHRYIFFTLFYFAFIFKPFSQSDHFSCLVLFDVKVDSNIYFKEGAMIKVSTDSKSYGDGILKILNDSTIQILKDTIQINSITEIKGQDFRVDRKHKLIARTIVIAPIVLSGIIITIDLLTGGSTGVTSSGFPGFSPVSISYSATPIVILASIPTELIAVCTAIIISRKKEFIVSDSTSLTIQEVQKI